MDINFLELNIDQLRNNISIIKAYAQTRFCLPVKANAYGHGLSQIVESTKDIVDFYATACAAEALEVYKIAPEVPILIFGVIETAYLKELIHKEIRVTIHCLKDLEYIEKYSNQCRKKAKVHLFINTGMNMLGVDCDQSQYIIQKIYDSNYTELEGVYSHLACADDIDNEFNNIQINKFRSIQAICKRLDSDILCHLANSYGCVGRENISFDMVRPGILSYGFLPSFSVDDTLNNIKPIAKLTTQIIKIIKLTEFQKVGYGLSYSGNQNDLVAILPIGYGDGFSRQFSNNSCVYIEDTKYPVIGRINMDTMAISLGKNLENIQTFAQVEIISNLSNRENSAKNLAKKLGTVEYEIVTSVSTRVIRKQV